MIRAISLDLDDTLWPIAPTIQRAEQALHQWLSERLPHIASDWSMERLRAHRDAVALAHPHLAHDFTAQRKLSLASAIGEHSERDALVEGAFEVFYSARNSVDLYADADAALRRLHARLPLISLSNGNADLQRIGLAHLFHSRISARDVGAAKPEPGIFQAACAALKLPAHAIAHVGDDPVMDVIGARQAGMFAVWLNRDGRSWSQAVQPDLEIRNLAELCDWLEGQSVHVKEGKVNEGTHA
jgi:FMN hydrolase / 5-amino-6-(5-phospho-D-ribitylamino)uracil phosphatase